MARLETEKHPVAAKNQIEPSLREQALSALEKKIAQEPFYIGRNSLLIGLSTPIWKNRSNTVYAPGSTPQDFYQEKLSEEKIMNSTPEDIATELEREKEAQKEAEDTRSADEIFGATLIVRQKPSKQITMRRDGSRIIWKAQRQWERKWEMVGEYLGGKDTLEDIGNKHRLSHQRIIRVAQELIEDAEIHFYGYKQPNPGRKAEGKPHALMNLRFEIGDEGSEISNVLADIEKGVTTEKLNKKYGNPKIGEYRGRLADLGVIIPFGDSMKNPKYRDSFSALSDPETSFEHKKELLSRVTRGRLGGNELKALHISVLSKVLEEVGLYVAPQHMRSVIKQMIERDPEFYVHSLSLEVKDRESPYYYHFIADADISRVQKFARFEEFDKHRVPPLRTFGKPLPSEAQINTYELKKGVKSGIYRAVGEILSKEARNLIEQGIVDYSDIINYDCPGEVHITRRGSIYVRAEEFDAVTLYVKEKEKKLLETLQG